MSCNCGSSCNCGDNCSCGKRNLEFGYLEKTTTQTIIAGVAPVKMNFESSTMSIETEHGCKCGSNCSCDPCKC
ncbi:Metallothionein, family 15, plant [Corchorus capsularis]|uniref:Metallothionein-like protein n=1 Tax=Corchorus capsularis TaxID=210143 RepID=A0A1R3IP39_COCAP|nr:Metallothionein, family 15, plant [Corchorus capsularis]